MTEEKKKSNRGRPREWTPEKLKKLGKELHEYCKKDDVYHICEFEILEKGQTVGWLKTIANRWPEFRPVLKSAQHILGAKIVKESMNGKSNPFITNTFVPMYMQSVDDYQELKKERELKRQIKLEEHKKKLSQPSEEFANNAINDRDELIKKELQIQELKSQIEQLQNGKNS